MSIELYPYIFEDGVPSIKDSELKALYQTMANEGSLPVVFYDCPENDLTWEWFYRFMVYNCTLFVIMEYQKDAPVGIMGMVWINNISGRTADIHYCMFSPAWGRSDEICTEAMSKLFEQTNIDCFIALIADTNILAVDKPLNYGFTKAAKIPKMCWVEAAGEACIGHLYYIIRE